MRFHLPFFVCSKSNSYGTLDDPDSLICIVAFIEGSYASSEESRHLSLCLKRVIDSPVENKLWKRKYIIFYLLHQGSG